MMKKIDSSDLMVVFGLALSMTGLALISLELAVVALGIFILIMGLVAAERRSGGE